MLLPIDDYYDFHKQALEKMLKLSKSSVYGISKSLLVVKKQYLK